MLLLAALSACAPKVTLFGEPGGEPLAEEVLEEGTGPGKVLLLHVEGFLSAEPRGGLFGSRPSLLEELAARLDKARDDQDVAALVLAVNSPGGGVTATDVMHRELTRFREDTGVPMVAVFRDVAASGGYYIAADADRIVAHPTTVTGSIGTIAVRPIVAGLTDMLGVRFEVDRSGALKDMGSPLRNSTAAERALFQTLIEEMNARFQAHVRQGRGIPPGGEAAYADGRVLTAGQALRAGLVDELGYLEDGYAAARELAELPEDAPVVVYRRGRPAEVTAYDADAAVSGVNAGKLALDFGLSRYLPALSAGVYYLWAPGLGDQAR